MEVNILQTIVNYIIPTFLGFIIGYVVDGLKEDRKEEKAIKNAVLAILRNELVRLYREYEIKGTLPILDKENIEAMFNEYKHLGGNGTVEHLINELLKLPTQIMKN